MQDEEESMGSGRRQASGPWDHAAEPGRARRQLRRRSSGRGNLVIVSGQLCLGLDGKIADAHKGKLGSEVSMEAGQEAARLCAINVLAQLKAAIGDLDGGRALRAPRRLHQRRADLRAACARHERRLRPDGRGARRQGPPCPLDHRRRRIAARRRGRGRRDVRSPMKRTILAASTPIAHRGLHDTANGIIENTPAAADAAIARGFAIECDVQLTADGEAVVFHDFTSTG